MPGHTASVFCLSTDCSTASWSVQTGGERGSPAQFWVVWNRTTMRGICTPKTAFDYLRHVRNEQLHWSVASAIVCLPAVTGEPENGFRWHLVTDSLTDIPEHVQTSTNPDNRNGNFTWRPRWCSCAYLMNNL